MTETVCYYCANDGTPGAPLVRDEDDHLAHVQRPCKDATGDDGERIYPEDDPETPIPVCGHVECQENWDPCPPIPDGFKVCMVCLRARPVNRLAYAASMPTRPGRGFLGSNEMIVASRTAALTDKARDPLFVCRFGGCAGRTDQRHGGFKQVMAHRVGRNQEPQQDQGATYLDAVPTDGDGMTIKELMAAWGRKERSVRDLVARFVETGALRSEDVPTRAGGAPRKVYWRVDR